MNNSATKKFVLFLEDVGYLAKEQSPGAAVRFTNDLDQAIKYSDGLDNLIVRLGHWNGELKKSFNTWLKFEPVEENYCQKFLNY